MDGSGTISLSLTPRVSRRDTLEPMTLEMEAESRRRIHLLQEGFIGAPQEYQPLMPIKIPSVVPYTEGQMITWEHLKTGRLPVQPQLDTEGFPTLGCVKDCTNCSVPAVVRHRPQVLMRPVAWGRVFKIIEEDVVARENPGLPFGVEPIWAPYMRILGGEPFTYTARAIHGGRSVILGDIVDIMRLAKRMPIFMAGLFADGLAAYQQPDIMEGLVDVLERFHTSVDYLPRDELPDIYGPGSDREKRASYGAYVATYYASRGIDSVANIVLIPPDEEAGEAGNLDEILEISELLWSRGVSTTYCPIQTQVHRAQHDREKKAYATELRREHILLIRKATEELVKAQLSGKGLIRNGRSYLEGMHLAGVDQLISLRTGRGTPSFSPNLRMGYDSVLKTIDEIRDSPGEYYGYGDHQGKWDGVRWGSDYLDMLEFERQKWLAILDSGRPVATRVDPVALVKTIEQALDYWSANNALLEPSFGGKGEWWGNTIKNTKVGKYRGVYRKDIR